MRRFILSLATLTVTGFLLLAFVGNAPARRKKADEKAVVYRGARLLTTAGAPIERGVLVIQGGKITAVGGPDTEVPEGAEVVEVAGATIIPGLVDTHSHIGIWPRPHVPAHGDGNEGSGAVQSGLRAEDAIYPNDPGIRMAVAGGVTTANIMPGSGNVIGGQTLYVKLRGNTIDAMRVEADKVLGGLKMANGENPKRANFGRAAMPPGTRMKLFAMQREQFLKARDYQRRWDMYRQDKKDGKAATQPDRDPAMDTLVEVLERKRTVHFHTHRADDIMSVLRLAKEFNFEVVLQHVTEGYKVVKELAARKAPVSLTLIDSPGGKLEAAGLIEENAAILEKAGVPVAINTDDYITESRFFLRTGAIAVRGGMSEDAALRALTINPARMMHLDHRLGSLEKGKDADFVVLSGSPFSVYTQVLRTFIDGKCVFDRNKHEDWTYQAGGFAFADRARLPKKPALAKAPAPAKAPNGSEDRAFNGRASEYLVVAGRVHTVAGETIANGYVHVKDGKIAAVGKLDEHGRAPEVARGTPVLKAAVVTPGLIDAHTVVGISGAFNVAADQDQDERSDPNQADLRVLDGFNPNEPLLEFLRRNGVTAIHAVPGRVNVIAGQTGVFRTSGGTADGMKLKFPAGILVNLGEVVKGAHGNKLPTTRMGTAALVRNAFTQARNYSRKSSGKGDATKGPAVNPKLDALGLALERKVPVIFAAHRADDLATGLRLAKEFGLKARLDLATEGYLMAGDIAKAEVPVVVHPTMQRAAGSMETLHGQLCNAATLADKKVHLAIGTGFEGYVPKTRVLRHEAAIAMINGLGYDRALAAITLDAAKILGIDDQRGSIEKGKVADLVLFDGDPFEHTTQVTQTISGGRVVYDRGEYLKTPFVRRAIPLGEGGGVGCCLGIW
jgi:imidazolonepropionase-like amidohydrolase